MTPAEPVYIEARRVLLDALVALAPHRLSVGRRRRAGRIPSNRRCRPGGRALHDRWRPRGRSRLAPSRPLDREHDEIGGLPTGGPPRSRRTRDLGRGSRHRGSTRGDPGRPDRSRGRRATRRQTWGASGSPWQQGRTTRTRTSRRHLVDKDPITISALDSGDPRSITVDVAGVAALMVAKAHKLHDRVDRPSRLDDKDAADVFRMMQVTTPATVGIKLAGAARGIRRRDPPTVAAVGYINELFGRRGQDRDPHGGTGACGCDPRGTSDRDLCRLHGRVA